MSGVRDTARRRAREVAFRVVYQSDVTRDDYAQAWTSRREEEHLEGDPLALVEDVIGWLAGHAAEIDGEIEAAAEHWPLARLSATDRSVLRAAVAELMCRSGTPARVILDEAIDIAKRYGSEESGRFVNGVLDRVARRLRGGEF